VLKEQIQKTTAGPLFIAAKSADRRAEQFWSEKISAHRNVKGLASEIIEITPERAEWLLLNSNAGNRPLRDYTINEYARAMTDGRWRLHSQGISIARDGRLNNGQHRMSAVVKAGVPVRFYVTFGEDRAAFDVLDTGSKRTASDMLANAGVDSGYRNTISAMAPLINTIGNGSRWTRNHPMQTDEILAFTLEHESACVVAASAAHRLHTKFRGPSSAYATAYFLIARSTKHGTHLDGFWDLLATGENLASKSPVYVLREALISKRFYKLPKVGGRDQCLYLAAGIVKSWNRYVSKQVGKSSSLVWPAGEPFPAVI
jgi:hypothetical protein